MRALPSPLRALRWLAGMGLATWRAARALPRMRVTSAERAPEPAPAAARTADGLQPASTGVGPMFHRTYSVEIEGSEHDAARLLDLLGRSLNAVSPVEVAVFDKTLGDGGGLARGDEFVVRMPGPWDGPVRVVDVDGRSFRFATLDGHMEAGEIEFRVVDVDGPGAGPHRVRFEIRSSARSADRLFDLIYDRIPIARFMQRHMWFHVCERVVELSGGRAAGKVSIHTERAA